MTAALVVDGIADVPFYDGQTRACRAWVEVSVNTVIVKDAEEKERGAVAVAFSNTGRADGVVTYHTADQAEAFVALVQNAIDDARRVERGEPMLARGGPYRLDS